MSADLQIRSTEDAEAEEELGRDGRRVGPNQTVSDKELLTEVANKLAGGTDNDLLRVAALCDAQTGSHQDFGD